jgi:hypothetical protein
MPLIPTAQSARIREINDVFWRALDDSLDDLDDTIAQRSRLAMAKIRKSGFKASVIRRETKKITTATNDSTARLIAQQVEAAALYAQRAADVIRAWQISGRLKEGVEHLTVSDSALKRARLPGAAAIDAEAATARIAIAPLKSRKEVAVALKEFGTHTPSGKLPPGDTSGTRVMKGLIRTNQVQQPKAVGMSTRLHGAAKRVVKETNEAVGTAIREASNMNKAGRDIVMAVQKGGEDFAVNRRLTKPLMRLKRAGRTLQKLSVSKADPDALKEATKAFDKEFRKIRRVASKLVDARGGYQELIQIIEKQGFQGMDKALGRWLDEKQNYFAEQTAETESAAAYRSREALQHENKPYITGWWWRRNAGMVQLDLKRRKDIRRVRRGRRGGKNAKRETKGRPCRVCPALADNFFPMSYLREFPRGAHTNCRFWPEFKYDTAARDRMPVTQADVDWFESLPD